jgi:signal transduction histidine kinase
MKRFKLTALKPRDRGDVLLAAVFTVISVAQVLISPIADPVAIGVVIALGSTLPLAWRRTYPAAAALAGTAIWIVPSDGFVVLGYIAGFLLFYSVGAHVASLRAMLATTAAGLVLSVIGALTHTSTWVDYINVVTVVLGPVAVGRFVRHQREQSARLRELTLHLERERERSAGLAVAEERARIARELHDVVAHGISVVAIQADAAEAALDSDPELARGPIGEIKRTARESLGEMRGLLGVLREADEGAERSPLPGLEQLPDLLERSRAGGLDVELRVEGDAQPLPQGVDLAAYRILQESLTNVRKHAGAAPTVVDLDWREDALELRVRDHGIAANGDGQAGHGLIGMRERARAHGGSFSSGPAVDGGYEVRAILPLKEPA